jgi:Flp pilus assembly protein TadB
MTRVGLAAAGGATLMVVLGLVVDSPALVGGGPLGTGLWWHRRGLMARAAAEAIARSELIELVDVLIQHLRSGGSLRAALGASGVTIDEGSSGRAVVGDEGLLVATVTVLVDRGGPALPSLERLSDVLRSNQALRAELMLQSGQATASVALLVLLPAVFVVALAGADARLRHFYLFEAAGATCLLVAALLSYGGWWTIHRLIGAGR